MSKKETIEEIRSEYYDADKLLRGIENLFNSDKEDYYKPIRTGNAFTDEIIEELFDFLLRRYQEKLEQSMRRSEFAFDSVDLLYYKFHKISLNRVGSYIDSPKYLKDKKLIINPKINDDKCFQYAITVVLNHKNIVKHLQRI